METSVITPKVALVLVQADPKEGWSVRLPGVAKSAFFRDRARALSYAKAWASTNRPTTMRVSGVSGNFPHGWSFR
jgi:hypothetical protein